MPDIQASSSALLDLNWCISSPSILAPSVEGIQALQAISDSSDNWLDISKISHQTMQTHLDQNTSHFLGPYFEQLWKFYLQAHPRFELIASNLQIHDAGKTIGEFDFIVYDQVLKQHFHQELAIKFYLGWSHNNKTLWIGPQEVDRLDKKLDHLLHHQIPLSSHPLAKKKLELLGVKSLTPQIIMKGSLFEPLHLSGLTNSIHLSPEANREKWLPFSRLERLLREEPFAQAYWKPLSKKEWLRPVIHKPGDQPELLDKKALLHFINIHRKQEADRPILLSCLLPSIKDGTAHFREQLKLFLVADHWPRLTKSSPAL